MAKTNLHPRVLTPPYIHKKNHNGSQRSHVGYQMSHLETQLKHLKLKFKCMFKKIQFIFGGFFSFYSLVFEFGY